MWLNVALIILGGINAGMRIDKILESIILEKANTKDWIFFLHGIFSIIFGTVMIFANK